MRRRFPALTALLRGQMSDWLHSPRTVIMGLVILALAFMNAKSLSSSMEQYSLTSNVGEGIFMYLSTGFGNILSISAFFLIMVSEIPRRNAFQNSMLIRSSRSQWLRSQILFCFTVVALMMLLMILLSMVLSIPSLSPGSGWSTPLELDPDAPWVPSFVPEYIRVLPPWQANLLSAAILFAFWFTMVLVILLCSLAGRPNLGLILYVFLLVLHVTVMWENLPPFLRHMPTWYSNLSSIAGQYPDHELETVPIVLVVYAIVDFILIGLMHLQVRTMDMRFAEKEKA